VVRSKDASPEHVTHKTTWERMNIAEYDLYNIKVGEEVHATENLMALNIGSRALRERRRRRVKVRIAFGYADCS